VISLTVQSEQRDRRDSGRLAAIPGNPM